MISLSKKRAFEREAYVVLFCYSESKKVFVVDSAALRDVPLHPIHQDDAAPVTFADICSRSYVHLSLTGDNAKYTRSKFHARYLFQRTQVAALEKQIKDLERDKNTAETKTSKQEKERVELKLIQYRDSLRGVMYDDYDRLYPNTLLDEKKAFDAIIALLTSSDRVDFETPGMLIDKKLVFVDLDSDSFASLPGQEMKEVIFKLDAAEAAADMPKPVPEIILVLSGEERFGYINLAHLPRWLRSELEVSRFIIVLPNDDCDAEEEQLNDLLYHPSMKTDRIDAGPEENGGILYGCIFLDSNY